jgi:hypothetical protein
MFYHDFGDFLHFIFGTDMHRVIQLTLVVGFYIPYLPEHDYNFS